MAECGRAETALYLAPQAIPGSFRAEGTSLHGGTSPLEGDVLRRRGIAGIWLVGRGCAIKNADRIGLQFDDELLNRVIDGFALADRNLDDSVVVTGCKLALDENVGAFVEAGSYLLEAFAEGNNVVPLGLFFPLVVVVLPGPLCSYRELHDGRAVRQELQFGIFAEKSNDRKLIQVHGCFSSSALLLGHLEASGGCSQA